MAENFKKYEGHLVKSEISNTDGKWNKEALDFSKDVHNSMKRILKKHKGKLSLDSMQMIGCSQVMTSCIIEKSFAILKITQ